MTSEQHYATVARLSDSLSDETSKPRYRRLKDGLTLAIERGELRGGAMLPSSRVLAEHLDVSRNTVNRAYRELAVEGFIEPIERVGYVVNEGLGEGDAGRPDRYGSSTPRPVRWDERLGALAEGDDEPRPCARHCARNTEAPASTTWTTRMTRSWSSRSGTSSFPPGVSRPRPTRFW